MSSQQLSIGVAAQRLRSKLKDDRWAIGQTMKEGKEILFAGWTGAPADFENAKTACPTEYRGYSVIIKMVGTVSAAE